MRLFLWSLLGKSPWKSPSVLFSVPIWAFTGASLVSPSHYKHSVVLQNNREKTIRECPSEQIFPASYYFCLRSWKTYLFFRLRSLRFCPFIWILDEQLMDLSLFLAVKVFWLNGDDRLPMIWEGKSVQPQGHLAEYLWVDSQTIFRLLLHWRLWTLAWVKNKSSSRHQGNAHCKGWKMCCANDSQVRDMLVCITLCLEIWLISDPVKSCHMLFHKIRTNTKWLHPATPEFFNYSCAPPSQQFLPQCWWCALWRGKNGLVPSPTLHLGVSAWLEIDCARL